MKSTFLRWASALAAALSATWVFLLAALVFRCKFMDQPFPVLAKFSPFREHLVATDRMVTPSPLLAPPGIASYRERSFRAIRPIAIMVGISELVPLLAVGLNPGGYISWFLS